MQANHDRSYHLLFSEPVLLADLVRNFVDEPWVAELDFERLEYINAKLYSDTLIRREGDLIVRIPFLNKPQQEIYLLLLLEFQSTIDPWMAVRFGTYVCLLYQHIIKEKRFTAEGKLPPVFPLLLYNGDNHWQAATSINQLIALPDKTPLWQYQPQMQYYLVDESRYPDGKSGSLSGLIFKLENAATPQAFREALDEMVTNMPPQLHSLKRALSVWVTHVLAPHKGMQLDRQHNENLDEVKVMLATRIQQWEDQLIAQGWQQGMERGVEQEKHRFFVKLITRKFGPLPAWAEHKITAATPAQIEQWADKIFDAESLEAVFE